MCIFVFSLSSGDKDGSKVTTVVATPGQGPDRPQEVSYTDTKVIGNGSFGVVYQAKLCDSGELVAIKKVLQDKRFKVKHSHTRTAHLPSLNAPLKVILSKRSSSLNSLSPGIHCPNIVKPKQTFVESMNLTESNCEGDVNWVIFHKNGEISEAAKQEKAKGKNVLLCHRHILALMCKYLCRKWCTHAGKALFGRSFLNKLEPTAARLSCAVKLPLWIRHFLLCGALQESSSCALNRFWLMACCSRTQHTDNRSEAAKPAEQLLRFSLKLEPCLVLTVHIIGPVATVGVMFRMCRTFLKQV